MKKTNHIIIHALIAFTLFSCKENLNYPTNEFKNESSETLKTISESEVNDTEIEEETEEKNLLTEPEHIGPYVFDILKNLNTMLKQDYLDKFLTLDELMNVMIDSGNFSKEEIQEMEDEISGKDIKKWNEKIEEPYIELKEEAVYEGIKWGQIEYLDFIYKKHNEDGIEGTGGDLYFDYNDNTYSIKVLALNAVKEYKLVMIGDLEESY